MLSSNPVQWGINIESKGILFTFHFSCNQLDETIETYKKGKITVIRWHIPSVICFQRFLTLVVVCEDFFRLDNFPECSSVVLLTICYSQHSHMWTGPGLDPHKVFSFLKWVWFLFNLFVFALSIVGCWGNRSLCPHPDLACRVPQFLHWWTFTLAIDKVRRKRWILIQLGRNLI